MISTPKTFNIDVLAALVAVGGLLTGAKIRLFKSNTTFTKDSVLADFDTADFTGYADSAAITWAAPFADTGGEGVLVGDLKQFLSTGPVLIANTIYGYVVMDTGSTDLLFGDRFDEPVLIGEPGITVAVLPVFGDVSQALAP